MVTFHDGEGHSTDIGERPDANPMVREAQDFAAIMNDPVGHHLQYTQWFQLAKQVNQTLFDLRSSAGIVFPADQKEM